MQLIVHSWCCWCVDPVWLMKAPEGIVGCGYSWLSYPMLLLAVAVICKACMLLDASNFPPYYSRCLKWSPLPCFALLICWAAELRAQWSSMRRLKACSWAALLCAVNLLSWMHAAVAAACRCICMLQQSLVGQCRFKFFSSRAPAELAVPVCDGCGGLQAVCRPARLHPDPPATGPSDFGSMPCVIPFSFLFFLFGLLH